MLLSRIIETRQLELWLLLSVKVRKVKNCSANRSKIRMRNIDKYFSSFFSQINLGKK